MHASRSRRFDRLAPAPRAVVHPIAEEAVNVSEGRGLTHCSAATHTYNIHTYIHTDIEINLLVIISVLVLIRNACIEVASF